MALKDTYVRMERDYDEEGNMTAERYYGPDNEMIPCSKGYDEIRFVDGETVYYLNGDPYTSPAEEEPASESAEEDAA